MTAHSRRPLLSRSLFFSAGITLCVLLSNTIPCYTFSRTGGQTAFGLVTRTPFAHNDGGARQSPFRESLPRRPVTTGLGLAPSDVLLVSAVHGTTPTVTTAEPFFLAASSQASSISSSTIETSTLTFDPAEAFAGALGGLVSGPGILAVPIIAAFGLASVVAFLLVSYANPASEDGGFEDPAGDENDFDRL